LEQLGPSFQSFDQPGHRQRIPVTVIKQVSPDSVSFALRSLVHGEEDPGDFDASLGDQVRPAHDDALSKTLACLSSNFD